jgi:hypothetical protein
MGPLWCHLNFPISGSSSTRALIPCDAPPSSLLDSIMNLKVNTLEGEGVGAHSLACSTLGVEGCAGAPGWGLGRLKKNLITHTYLHKPNNELVSA